MARKPMSSMLGNIEAAQAEDAPPEVAVEPPTRSSRVDAAENSPTKAPAKKPRVTKKAPAQSVASTTAGYDDFLRKEARLIPESYDELTRLARRLERERVGEGRRITENTLIRLGVAWVLQNADRLSGSTEEDLARSVGLR